MSEKGPRKGGKDTERPVFDWDNISYGDAEQASVVVARFGRATDSNDPEAVQASALEMRAIMARVLLSVPRSWLIDSAPNEIDWRDPDNIARWVKSSRMRALIQTYNSTDDAAGESNPA